MIAYASDFSPMPRFTSMATRFIDAALCAA